jgi:hypothetical protein
LLLKSQEFVLGFYCVPGTVPSARDREVTVTQVLLAW